MSKKVCSEEDCEKVVRARGLCGQHYARWRRRNTPKCAVEGCENNINAKGMCNTHYLRMRIHGSTELPEREIRICAVEDCDRTVRTRGWCAMHYLRWFNNGTTELRERVRTFCATGTCNRPVEAWGMCSKHYARWRKHGDPLGGGRSYETPEESFANRVEPQGDCLFWTGSRDESGYGHFWTGEVLTRAHRYAWMRVNGPIPDGMLVDHICHNKPCVEVKHLRLATHQQNIAYRSGPTIASTSGIRGVYERPHGWVVQVNKKNDRRYFGPFDDVEEAKNIAHQTRKELYGEFAGKG